MNFDGFDLMPRTRAGIPLQRRIGAILEAEKVAQRGPRCNRVVAWVEDPVPAGATLPAAHANWNGPDLPAVDGFPARALDELCPADVIRVAVEYQDRLTGGMGSYYGFDGFFLSALVSLAAGTLWDVRGERAS